MIGYRAYRVDTQPIGMAPSRQEFDLDAFSSAMFQDAITQRRKAEDLSAVLYPNAPRGAAL